MRMKKMGFFNPEKNTIKNEKKIQTNKKPKQTKNKYCQYRKRNIVFLNPYTTQGYWSSNMMNYNYHVISNAVVSLLFIFENHNLSGNPLVYE